MAEPGKPNPPADPGAFDLRNVSWGYRRIFADTIAALRGDGAIGPAHAEATKVFFDTLAHARPGSLDFALKEFLGGLNARTKWLLDLPGLFADLCELGLGLAREKLAHGIAFFRLWGAGGFGDAPAEVQALLDHVRTLRETSAELAQAFMGAYETLLDHLDARQIDRFVSEILRLHRTNPRSAADFAALRLKSAMTYVRSLTQEARLDDLRDRLERLARAVSGRGLKVEDLSALDSDALIERRCNVVCFQGRLFLPTKIRCCATRPANEALYLLATAVSAEAVRGRGFAAIHGGPGRSTLPQWLGDDPRAAAVVSLIEVARVLDGLARRMPGTRRLIDFGVALEFDMHPPRTRTDAILYRCLTGRPAGDERAADARAAGAVLAAARQSDGCLDAAARAGACLAEVPEVLDAAPRALIFYPDPYYPGEVSAAPSKAAVADLGRRTRRRPTGQPDPADVDDLRATPAEAAPAETAPAIVYPEWNHLDNAYYEDWCFLRERVPSPDRHFHTPADPRRDAAARRARRMFERLKPDLARKEKYLSFGDEINIDLLVEHMAQRRRLGSAAVRFYQKTFIKKRDLAVALLLDVSGSTAGVPAPAARGAGPGAERIIDLVRHAAMTLGEGLDALGDPFAIYGFSGNGREHCDFFIFKDLHETFDDAPRRRLQAAQPMASTRIGVAIRHATAKLADAAARKRLILLVTDGRPQDAGYDPATRYAQYDVRMACQEAARRDIQVVGVSTCENTRADLEIMFPQRRFVVLDSMARLADVLPALYLKMTA